MNEKIKQEARNVDWQNNDAIIEFYERNQLYFNNFATIADDDTLINIIQIKANYINALIAKMRFSKAKNTLASRNVLLQKIAHHPTLFAQYTEKYTFYAGIVNGNLKNYKEALKIFKQLTRIDPENDIYQDWLSQMKLKLQSKRLSIIGYLGLAIIFTDIYFGLVYKHPMRREIVAFAFLLALIPWVLPRILQLINHLLKKRHRSI